MAYELTNGTLEIFNEKYGTDISVSKYLSEAKRTSPNEALISIFTEAYKKAVTNDLLKGGIDHKSQHMFADFSKDVIDSLIWELPLNNKPVPAKDAGLSKPEQYNLMEEALGSIPTNEVDLVAEQYKNGNIRIRDMVEYANSKTMYSKLDSSTTTIMASYAEALKNVNATRSFFWKVFHPFRNHAEKRDAKLIQSIVTEINGENAYKAAARRAGDGLRNFSDIKSVTTHSTLGVYKVEEYDPNKKEDLIEALDPVLDSDKIDELQGHEKLDELNFDVNIFGNNTKEKLSIDSLKEQPFASKES